MDIPFATVADVEERWRELSEDEETRCGALLSDASVMIAAELSKRGTDVEGIDPDGLLGKSLTSVTCSMVIRSMKTPVDQQATTNYTQSAVGYSESFAYANPSGDLYLTKTERRQLGIGGADFGVVLPDINRGCAKCGA